MAVKLNETAYRFAHELIKEGRFVSMSNRRRPTYMT
jgi:hypothetical protein